MSENHPLLGFPPLDLPKPDFITEQRKNGLHVWDSIRKKWLLLSPEEWVRQHAIHWLVTRIQYPVTLLGIEKQVVKGKRIDILGYDRGGSPLLLVECKAPDVAIHQQTVQQAMLYFAHAKARFLWLTNGRRHHVFQHQEKSNDWAQIAQIPDFEEMLLLQKKKE